MLIDRQRLPASVTRDQLKLSVSQARVPGQPGDRLVPEGVRGRLDPGFLGVLGDDLLDTARVENLPCLWVWKSQRLCGWAAMWVLKAVAKDLPKSTYLSFEPLPWLILILQASISTSEIPKLQSSPTRTAVKNKSLSIKSVLHVLGTIDDLIEPPELVGGQDTGQPTPLLLGSEVTDLADLLCNVPPGIIVQTLLA